MTKRVNKFQTAIAITKQPVLDEEEKQPVLEAPSRAEEQNPPRQVSRTEPTRRRRVSKVSSGRANNPDYEAVTIYLPLEFRDKMYALLHRGETLSEIIQEIMEKWMRERQAKLFEN